ncbi:hypothetical protein HGP16_26075 [Rhizobium sp. P40RR-XXII]|uniref:hypothetical protein n=1 Tax=unclassified Rhizobium TaxID=2613769 RepID=UPI0014568CDB|nr:MULTISPECIES: hypothetical protein [unclassified Rhizobium]NLR85353.1 hypothetical protein [Rhizobium sp. P28RR-XV]NLS20009.1 hypothetical protein [Rhizobium sp. P40RR-XXII]
MHTQNPLAPSRLGPELYGPGKVETIGPPCSQVSDETTREAYERGGAAGIQEKEDEENPYPEGTLLAKAFEHGYLDGQKAHR